MKNLHHTKDLSEIISRIESVSVHSPRKWGRMEAGQMLQHCAYILEIPLGLRAIGRLNFFYKAVGIAAKWELKLFNTGIPPYMPTFKTVIVKEKCNFDECKDLLLLRLAQYTELAGKGELPAAHALFGKLSAEDWGFLEYVHLDHHLKQFYC